MTTTKTYTALEITVNVYWRSKHADLRVFETTYDYLLPNGVNSRQALESAGEFFSEQALVDCGKHGDPAYITDYNWHTAR